MDLDMMGLNEAALVSIEEEAAQAYPVGYWSGDEGERALETVTVHVPALIAEIRRLRAEHDRAERVRVDAVLLCVDVIEAVSFAFANGGPSLAQLREMEQKGAALVSLFGGVSAVGDGNG